MTLRDAQTIDIREILEHASEATARMTHLTEQYASGGDVEDIFAELAGTRSHRPVTLDELEHGLRHEAQIVSRSMDSLRRALAIAE